MTFIPIFDIHEHTMKKTEIILTRMEPDLKAALQALAEQRGSNMAQIIRQACLEHVARSGVTMKKSSRKGGDKNEPKR